jgi:hypothetical protein
MKSVDINNVEIDEMYPTGYSVKYQPVQPVEYVKVDFEITKDEEE